MERSHFAWEGELRHPSHDPACHICRSGAGEIEIPGGVVFESDLWLLRPAPPPSYWGVPGWMMIQSKRHTPGIAHFDRAEAASFGPTLVHLERALLEITGALRIYTAAMAESAPHFHGHLVPRYAAMPGDAQGWGVFDLQRQGMAGDVMADPAEVERIIQAYRARLAADPPR
jgi:histidine triad (HIT) family protein